MTTVSSSVPSRGSARVQPAGARAVGPCGANEPVEVRVILRRRGLPTGKPSLEEHLNRHPLLRESLTREEYAARYGADPGEVERVVAFLASAGLTPVEVIPAIRTIKVSGVVAQFQTLLGITLHHYEGPVAGQTYRSHEGPINVPDHLAGVIVAVLGLDDREIGGRNGNPYPSTVTVATTTVPAIVGRYEFPTDSAAGQTIGVFATNGGYLPSDIDKYYDHLNTTIPSAHYVAPTVIPVPGADGTTNTSPPSGETTQDICIAGTVAQGATIAVYFFQSNEAGWVDALQAVTVPAAGQPTPSVVTCSYFVTPGDDSAGLINPQGNPVPTSVIDAISLAFQDATGHGITICVASGDAGADSGVDVGQHVQYPATDPWVLCCGGTATGQDSSGNLVADYVWNDYSPDTSSGDATGGGVSAYFAQPIWQQGVGVPMSLLTGKSGRGIPDVAANSCPASGYNKIYVTDDPDFTVGKGTSAAAPLYAGLFAVINAVLGTPVGFVNPVLYALGNTVCADVDPFVVGGPLSNGRVGEGYIAGPGWDACTGWGTIVGQALLTALKQPSIMTKQCAFVMDRSTYGKDEINTLLALAPGNALIDQAFWITVDGYTPTDLGITTLSDNPNFPIPPSPAQLKQWAPALAMTPQPPQGSLVFTPTAVSSDNPTLPASLQRFTFTYQAGFADDSAFAGLAPGTQTTIGLTATINGSSAETTLLLVDEPDPFVTNGATSWLSIDLRVFSLLNGRTRFGVGMTTSPNEFIQEAMANLTAGQGVTSDGDSFELLATDEEPAVFLYPTTLVDGAQVGVYNFALARVRYRSQTADAANVRVFFRTFAAQTTDTTYNQNTSYRRATIHGTADQPIPLLGINGSEFTTVPFFAAPRLIADGTEDMSWQTDPTNAQTIPHDPAGAERQAYFGCWLDLNQDTATIPTSYQPNNLDGPWAPGILGPIQQAMIASPHQCLVAELALDPSEPRIPTGASPSTSDKLAQRNLGWSDLA